MRCEVRQTLCGLALGLALLCSARATSIERLSFEQLADSSDVVVSGRINRSWTAWDENHKYIWTHYEISVTTNAKGAAAPVIEFAEPGGTLDGVAMIIPGSVVYSPGEKVFIFLQKMPNGYLRTTGWGQGKYSVDAAGRLANGTALRGLDLIAPQTPVTGTPLRSLEGMSIDEARARVVARARLAAVRGKLN